MVSEKEIRLRCLEMASKQRPDFTRMWVGKDISAYTQALAKDYVDFVNTGKIAVRTLKSKDREEGITHGK